MLALVEDMPEQPLAAERALPIEDAVVHRPTARPRIENIQETPQQPVSLYSNATTTTARLLFPGDEVFRSFIGCRERPTTFPWLHCRGWQRMMATNVPINQVKLWCEFSENVQENRMKGGSKGAKGAE